MRNHKRILSLALALVLVLGVAVIPASAESEVYFDIAPCTCGDNPVINADMFIDLGFRVNHEVMNVYRDSKLHYLVISIYEKGKPATDSIEIDLRTEEGRALYAEYEAKWLAMKNGETDKTTTPPVTTPAPTPTPTPTPAPSATPSTKQVNPDFDMTVFTDLGLSISWFGHEGLDDGINTYIIRNGDDFLDFVTNALGDKTYAKYKAIRDAAVGKSAETPRDDGITDVRFGDDGFFEDTSTVTEPSTVPPAGEPVEPATPTVFPDVASNAWYAEAVNAMTEAGLIKGDGNGNFRPNDAITYGEFVTILARVADLPTKATEGDGIRGYRTYNCYGNRVVKHGYGITPHWAAWANVRIGLDLYNKMVVNIEDLDCNVVRGHALSVIYKTMEYVGLDTTPVKDYTEADIPDWNDIVGVNNGWPGEYVYYIGDHLNFLPDQYIFGLDDADTPVGYDMNAVKESNPAMRPYVYAMPKDVLAMYNLGIVDGVDGAHTCAPLRSMTRAELCVLLYRAGLDHVFHV